MTFLMIIGSGRDKIYKNNIFRGVRIVAVILCTTGIALLAYMDGVDPKEGVSIRAEESKNLIYKGLPTFT